MTRRGFHAIPVHEEPWKVPAAEVPAAYNLQAKMQAAAEKARQNEAAETSSAGHNEEPALPQRREPRKAAQRVSKLCSILNTVLVVLACWACMLAVLGTNGQSSADCQVSRVSNPTLLSSAALHDRKKAAVMKSAVA